MCTNSSPLIHKTYLRHHFRPPLILHPLPPLILHPPALTPTLPKSPLPTTSTTALLILRLLRTTLLTYTTRDPSLILRPPSLLKLPCLTLTLAPTPALGLWLSLVLRRPHLRFLSSRSRWRFLLPFSPRPLEVLILQLHQLLR